MIYDMRCYVLKVGGLQTFIDAVRDAGLPIRLDYGIRLAGWYYTEVGTCDEVVHIWAYEDLAHYERARHEVHADPRWKRDYVARVGDLIVSRRNSLMRAPDFFPGPA